MLDSMILFISMKMLIILIMLTMINNIDKGCTGNELGICGWYFGGLCQGLYYEFKFLLEHAFFNSTIKRNIELTCNWTQCMSTQELSDNCMNLLDDASWMLGRVNVYNVFGQCGGENALDVCAGQPGNAHMGRLGIAPQNILDSTKRPHVTRMQQLANRFQAFSDPSVHNNRRTNPKDLRKSVATDDGEKGKGADESFYGPAACIDSQAASAYLMNPEVQVTIQDTQMI